VKKYAAIIALILGAGFWATSQFKEARRDRDSRSLTSEEAALLASLVENLRHPDCEVRLKAVRGLEAFNSIRVMPHLVKALSDPSPNVIVAAVLALQGLEHRIGCTGNRVLASLCSHPDERVRQVARRALPRLADWRAVPLLLEEAARPGCGSRALIFRTLEHVTGHSISGGVPDARAASLTARLDEVISFGPAPEEPLADEEVQELLATWREWYGKYGEKTPVDWLMDDLEAGTAEPHAAIAALERLDAGRASPLLVKYLQNDDSRTVAAAAKALRKLDVKEALPDLVAAAQRADREALRAISPALERFCERGDAWLLVDALEKSEGKCFLLFNSLLERLTAGSAPVERDEISGQKEKVVAFWRSRIAQTAQLTDLEAWSAAFRSDSARDRMQAVKNLPDSGEAAVPYLIDAMEDDSEMVRRAAERALRKITHYYFEFDSLASEADRAGVVRLWREWWERVKEMDTFSRLVSTLQNRGESVRHRADAALGLKELDDWRAIPHLIAALDEEPSGLRHYAAVALESITGRSFEPESPSGSRDEAQSAVMWRKWWERYSGKTKEFVFMATISDITELEGTKLEALTRLARMKSRRSIPYLVNLLENESFLLSVAAEECLERVTGKSFFYSPVGPNSDRASVRVKWQVWFASRQD